VRGEADVVVAGGGIAGVAAALAAARNGASVCLLEKESALGGLATLGNVAIYLPLCDGNGEQVVGGLGEELLLASVADGSGAVPAGWRAGGDLASRKAQRYRLEFNPASFLMRLEQLVLEAGIAILYDTRVCEVALRKGRITALLVENKSGRGALRCRYAVDATGDADLCARAGEPTVSLAGNVPAAWFYYKDKEGRLALSLCSHAYDPGGSRVPEGAPAGFAGDDGGQVTALTIAGRTLVREKLARMNGPGKGGPVFPVMLPAIPSFRMTRRLKGSFELEESDDGRRFDDAIGMVGDWRKKGPVFRIPYRSLTAVKTANLITAGRCISVGATGWDITRAIPACAVTGEAAGTAAALAARLGVPDLRAVPVQALREQLRAQRALPG
jgi:hypothetical protein